MDFVDVYRVKRASLCPEDALVIHRYILAHPCPSTAQAEWDCWMSDGLIIRYEQEFRASVRSIDHGVQTKAVSFTAGAFGLMGLGRLLCSAATRVSKVLRIFLRQLQFESYDDIQHAVQQYVPAFSKLILHCAERHSTEITVHSTTSTGLPVPATGSV